MRTAEEILEKNNAGGYVMDKRYRQLFGHREYLYNAMEEYAKQKTIAFAKWLNNEGYREYDESDRWISPEKSNHVFTTEQLYNKFEKELK